MVGLAENKANSAPIELELELELSLAKINQCPPLWIIFKGEKEISNLLPKCNFENWVMAKISKSYVLRRYTPKFWEVQARKNYNGIYLRLI